MNLTMTISIRHSYRGVHALLAVGPCLALASENGLNSASRHLDDDSREAIRRHHRAGRGSSV